MADTERVMLFVLELIMRPVLGFLVLAALLGWIRVLGGDDAEQT